MWFVYVLHSKKDKRLYVGCKSSIVTRIADHHSGRVISTRNRRPLVLIHTESFESKSDAFKRERFLKSLWGARFKKKLVREYLNRAKP